MALETLADSWLAVRAQFEDDDLDTVIRFRTEMPPEHVRLGHPIMMIIKWPPTRPRRMECLDKWTWIGCPCLRMPWRLQ